MCGIINFYDIRFNDRDIVSFVSRLLACIVLPVIGLALSSIFLKVWRLTRNLNEETIIEFKSQYPILTESLKYTLYLKLVLFWKPLYLLRWFFALLVLLVPERASFNSNAVSLHFLSSLAMHDTCCVAIRFQDYESYLAVQWGRCLSVPLRIINANWLSRFAFLRRWLSY